MQGCATLPQYYVAVAHHKAKCQVVPIWTTTLVPTRPTARQLVRRLIIGLVDANIELSETCRRIAGASQVPGVTLPTSSQFETQMSAIQVAKPLSLPVRYYLSFETGDHSISHSRTTNVIENVITLMKPRRTRPTAILLFLPPNVRF